MKTRERHTPSQFRSLRIWHRVRNALTADKLRKSVVGQLETMRKPGPAGPSWVRPTGDRKRLLFSDHTGLIAGAVTGRVISDLIGGRTPSIDMTPYRIDRF